jgi:CRP-like cAMP-binding protein
MFEYLFQSIDEKIQLTNAEKEFVKTFFVPKKIRKKQWLLQEGDVAKYIAFVEKGLLRAYTVGRNGTEHIIQFAFEGYWIGDQYSFLTGEPSALNIDAIEDCELLLLSKQSQDELLEKLPQFEKFFRLLLQNNLVATQKRMAGTLGKSAEQRYLDLLESCPTTINTRVPLHMLASYLGITPETLSRIRRQISQRK